MVTDQQKRQALSNVLKSNTFSKSTTTNALLRLLVETSIAQKEISTVTIGMELFGKKYDPEKNDVNIRVNISHLRKRLKLYYETEGTQDPVCITIAPGQYLATFDKRASNRRFPFYKAAIVPLALLIIGTICFLQFKSHDSVWQPLFENKKETTLYLGDVFGYRGPTVLGGGGWHRDARINSKEEFYQIVKENPQKYAELEPAPYTYVVFENSAIIQPFTRHFTQNNHDFSIRPSSVYSTKLIKDQNVIYMGPMYVQPLIVELFNEFARNTVLEVQTMPKRQLLYIYQTDTDTSIIDLNSSGAENEYAIAAAFNGPNNTRHHMFFSNHGMGLSALMDYYTNADSLNAFSKRHLQGSKEFIALYYVKGQDRTNVTMELIQLDNNR